MLPIPFSVIHRPLPFTARRDVPCVLLCACLLLGGTPPVSAQSPSSAPAIEGIVTDPSGGRVAGARISARCGTQTYEAVSGPQGRYRLPVRAGSCTVIVERSGFAVFAREIVVDGDRPAPLDVALRVEGLTDTVVVSATGIEQQLREAPASISVISRQQIEQRPVHDLGQLLRTVPGITGGLSPSGAMSKISLRGMEDKYSLMLVDGKRMGDSSGVNYRPDLGRQDLNWISPELIERIEVIRGPMSTLYGSDAMGGVINIITRRIPQRWAGSVSTNYTRSGSVDRGDARQGAFSVAGPIGRHLGLRLNAGVTQQSPDEVNISGNNGAAGVRDTSTNALLNWRVSGTQQVEFEASYGLQESLAPETPIVNAQGVPVAQSAWGPSHLTRTGFSVGHDGKWSFGSSRVRLFQSNYDSEVEGSTATSMDRTLEGSVDVAVDRRISQVIRVGGQFRQEELTNTQTIGNAPIQYDGLPTAGATLTGETAALFAEDNIGLSSRFVLTLGARLDHHEKFGSHTSPRAYAVYHPLPNWTVRGGVSQGFRAPNLKEHTANAATNSRGNGCTSLVSLGWSSASGGCWMAGNPNLKPETSTSSEIGAGFDRDRLSVSATYFHTNFTNKLQYTALGFFHGYWWTQMNNVEKARTRGLEASVSLPVVETVTLRSNVTWMLEAKNVSTGATLITTPEVSAYASVDWQPTTRLGGQLSAQYTGRQLGTGTTIVRGYTIFDLAGNYRISPHLRIRVGVENLFQKEIGGTTDFGFYQPRRRFFVGITAPF